MVVVRGTPPVLLGSNDSGVGDWEVAAFCWASCSDDPFAVCTM